MVATPVATVVDLLRELIYSWSGSIKGDDLLMEWTYSGSGVSLVYRAQYRGGGWARHPRCARRARSRGWHVLDLVDLFQRWQV